MAEPITNLTANWVPNSGIQLNWTAATDATVSSVYRVNILENVADSFPDWLLITELVANVTRNTNDTNYTLQQPLTSYFYNFPINVTLANSYAFEIIHVDLNGVSSNSATISVLPYSPISNYGVPHFNNFVSLDSFGQFITNPQDSYNEIAASVGVLMGTLLGQRVVVPSYGIQDLPMNEINVNNVQSAINKWEPRAKATVSLTYDNNNNATLNVNLGIQ